MFLLRLPALCITAKQFSVSASDSPACAIHLMHAAKKQTVLHQDRKLFKCTHRISGLFRSASGCRCIYRTRFRRLRNLFGTDFHPLVPQCSSSIAGSHAEIFKTPLIFIFCSCSHRLPQLTQQLLRLCAVKQFISIWTHAGFQSKIRPPDFTSSFTVIPKKEVSWLSSTSPDTDIQCLRLYTAFFCKISRAASVPK